jgi:DNA-binding transcriptional LysR family regulator
MAAKPYVNQHDTMVNEIIALKEKAKSRLSVSILNGQHRFLPPLFFKTFIEKYPDIALNIESFAEGACQNLMLEHSIQNGFSPGPINTNFFYPVYSDSRKVKLIVGKDHHLAGRTSVKLQELNSETIIMMNSRMYPSSVLQDLCAQAGIKPAIVLPDPDDLVFELCSTNRMVGFWTYSADVPPELLCIDIEDIDLDWKLYLIVNKYAHFNDALQKFIPYAQEQLNG